MKNKRTSRILSFLLSALLLVGTFSLTLTASAEDGIEANFYEISNGPVDKQPTATVNAGVEIDGRKVLEIIPTPDAAGSAVLTIDAYSIYSHAKVSLYEYGRAKIEYKYVSKNPMNSTMQLRILRKGVDKEHYTLTSTAVPAVSDLGGTIKCGEWATAEFDFGATVAPFINPDGDGMLRQIHFMPFGNSPCASVDPDDRVYIGKITFYKSEGGAPATATPASVQEAKPATASPVTSSGEPRVINPAALDGALTASFSKISNGNMDKHPNSIVTQDVEIDGRKVLEIAPTPDTADGVLTIDCYTIEKNVKVDLHDYAFASIEYKYVSEKPIDTAMGMKLLRKGYDSDHYTLTTGSTPLLSDSEKLRSGVWTTALFSFGDEVRPILNPEGDGLLRHIHFYPFGNVDGKTLSASDRLYIGDITFYKKNPDSNAKVTVSYVKGEPAAVGSIDNAVYSVGTEFSVPQCPYTLENGTFLGWVANTDGHLYIPGEVITLDRSITLTAAWDIKKEVKDYISISFPDYQQGPVDKSPALTTENTEEDGILCTKVVPVPEAGEKNAVVDGWSYKSAGIDLSKVNYVLVLYKYVSANPVNTNFKIAFLRKGGIFDNPTSHAYVSTEPLVEGSWQFAFFDVRGVADFLVPGVEPILNQMHVTPFGEAKVGGMSADDCIYIANFMFFTEEPHVTTHDAYMNGYGDGTFRPNNNMSRAEACTVVSRIAAGGDDKVIGATSDFTDVDASAWYAKYIGYCREKGYLASYPNGAFEPDKNITRAEFAELVYNSVLGEAANTAKTFSDVPASHPRYSSIMASASAGLIKGYEDGTFRPDNNISRAEVVTVINRAIGRSITTEQLSPDVLYTFTDVDPDNWAYPQIAEAAMQHIVFEDKWVSSLTSPSSFFNPAKVNFEGLYADADAKIAEIDALSEQRKAEIRATASDYSTITGTKYYVSSDGNDANDGLSPESAKKSLDGVLKLRLKAGDGVLFRRGDLFRGALSTVEGVTYSAYGEGAKPILTRSPENAADASRWELFDAEHHIWVYKDRTLCDVGVIVFNGGEKVSYKVLPYYKNDMYVIKNTDTPFDVKTGLVNDLDMFHDMTVGLPKGAAPKNTVAGTESVLYLRCDEGNPGDVFDSIELAQATNCISVKGNNVTIDNLCIMYSGAHGVGAGTVNGLCVKNCEFGYIGGSQHSYKDDFSLSRYGNAIEIYGGCEVYTVENNYIYEVYDAGVTHQYSSTGVHMNNVTYRNNLIENCVYDIEYFNNANPDGSLGGKNILFENNILRTAGYGWGNQRPDKEQYACIKGWSSANEFENYVIRNNILDRSVKYLMQCGASHKAFLPVLEGNTYIQTYGSDAYVFGTTKAVYPFDLTAQQQLRHVLGDKTAQIYYARPGR